MIIIKEEIDKMVNYDITFCSNKNCKQECERNQKNLDEKEVIARCGIWIGDIPDCEYFNKED